MGLSQVTTNSKRNEKSRVTPMQAFRKPCHQPCWGISKIGEAYGDSQSAQEFPSWIKGNVAIALSSNQISTSTNQPPFEIKTPVCLKSWKSKLSRNEKLIKIKPMYSQRIPLPFFLQIQSFLHPHETSHTQDTSWIRTANPNNKTPM